MITINKIQKIRIGLHQIKRNLDATEFALSQKTPPAVWKYCVINKQYIPYTNQLCECGNGWNAPFKFAVMENQVYHSTCLEKKLGRKKYLKAIKLELIILEQ